MLVGVRICAAAEADDLSYMWRVQSVNCGSSSLGGLEDGYPWPTAAAGIIRGKNVNMVPGTWKIGFTSGE